MKIAVISDSHNIENNIRIIKKYLSDVDIIIHCGDGADDIRLIEEEFTGEIYIVKGNCDLGGIYPEELVLEIEGKRILIAHGHKYNVKMNYNNIFYKALEIGADIVTFGHSHKAIILENRGITMMNPGSISLPYGLDKKTMGFIEIDKNGKTKFQIKEITS